MSTKEQDAVEALRGQPEAEQAALEQVVAAAEAVEEAEKKVPLKVERPRRRFRWVSDKDLTVERWLAGVASADIEVFPGVVFRFREAKNSELRDADSYVNAMGPKFMMRGMVQEGGLRDDLPRGEQWARARNVAMVAVSVTTMGGDPWPTGDTFAEKFREIDDMGHVKVDRLIQAMGEFTAQLAFMISETDLGNS